MIRSIKAETETQWSQIEALYLEAFPKNERKLFSMIRRKAAEGSVEVFWLGIENDETAASAEFLFGGLAIFQIHGELVLLDYFAIVPEWRGHGLGSSILNSLREHYAGRQVFLEVEMQDEKADNAEDRRRRKAFYLRNGMVELGICMSLFGVDMELLGFEKGITFESYMELQFAVNDPSRRKILEENIRRIDRKN